MQLILTKEEIICIRGSLCLELDITDNQLDDQRAHQDQDLDFSRTRALNKQILLSKVLEKVNKAVQQSQSRS